jgi:hypothetical protein
MPQSTNLNRNPYYDDFSAEKNFYKVLFKPGVTVQTRELTTLQSILQNQIEKFGNKFFSNGGVVIPGNCAYINVYNAVEIDSSYKGLNVEEYVDYLIGTVLTGSITGITAKVVDVVKAQDSIRNKTTLYVKYVSSASDFTTEIFENGEELTANVDIPIGESFIFSGESILVISDPVGKSSLSVGSAARIEEGVYFVRGYFVDVKAQTLILDQYSNTPSYRVGLAISEQIIDSNDDSSLNDNAQGFSNFAAPGADRFTITLTLSKKTLDDLNDDSFIELFRVENGVIRKIKNDTAGSFITDVLARRTFDESGNYYLQPYTVRSAESLNDRVGNGGIYFENQKTSDGSIPSEDLGLIKISPGKSYVKGYEVTTAERVVDFPKPRTTKSIESSSSSFYAGNLIRVNNVKNSPKIGLSTSGVISLYSTRLENNVATGSTIGYARVYDFESHNTSYESPASQFNLRLFDIQTYTNIITTTPTTGLPVGSYVQGSNSGAAGYIKSISDGDTNLALYQVSGKFIRNESIIVNGISSTSSVIGTVTDYSINDIKSISDSNGFVCDTLLSNKTDLLGPFDVSVYSPTGIATLTASNGGAFASNIKVSDIVTYQQTGFTSPVYARVSSINNTKTNITVVGVSTVVNICTGDVGIGTYSLQNISIIRPQISKLDDSSLYGKLKNTNISNVNLLNSNIYVKKQYTGITKTSTTLSLPDLSGTDYVYSSFDEERYIVINADGSIENLTNATFTLSSGGKIGTFTNLSATSGPCVVLTTQIKSNVNAKKKRYTRCNSISLFRTKYSTPNTAGLTYSPVYGTRVDDNQISLNSPDVVEVHAVYESSTTSDPTLPWIALTDLNSPNSNTSDLILGELLVGEETGAVAIVAELRNSSQIYLVYKTPQTFKVSEILNFKETGYKATCGTVQPGDRNIINEFILDNGQRKHFYDYARLVKKTSSQDPSGKLKIIFDTFTFDTQDSGDVITVTSYLNSLYGSKIPSFDGIRNTDTIDLRPRVGTYNPATNLSPFDFASRSFDTSGANSTQILASEEDIVFDYEFYIGRIDKLILSRDGEFELILGEPSETPIVPPISSEVLDICTIVSSPYVYDIDNNQDVIITLTDNRRFTMSDIRKINDRVDFLEYYTSLSLLESSTQSLLIEDANGLSRFKAGFFVDNFSDFSTADINNPSFNSIIQNNELSPTIFNSRVDLSLYSNDVQLTKSEINIDDTSSTNISLTGDTLTLDYTQVEYFKQPFASRVVNVNPFDIVTWVGNLELSPKIDTWTTYAPPITIWRRIPEGGQGSFNSYSNVPYIRSRNIQFTGTRLKPNTRFDLVFDSKNLSDSSVGKTFAFPKLLEVSDVTGTFTVGEFVSGSDSFGNRIQFRICVPNHKDGPHNSPSLTYKVNPYIPTVGISSLYGPQSTILNIDTESLNISNISAFSGNAVIGMTLYGQQSKATAKVSNNRLITDDNGTLIGSVFIPDSNTSSVKFQTGSSTVKLGTTQKPLGVPGESISQAETSFTSSGTEVQSTVVVWYDPLAQTFIVNEESGVVPTSIDLFFATKDDSIPVELQIREVVNGYPGTPDKIIPGLTKVLMPNQINVSSNATTATTFTFDSMVRLEGGREYALVVVSDSNNYTLWHSRVGEVEITTAQNRELGKVIINKQPSMGVMFKAQNGSTWIPSPEDDLKFTIRRADFTTAGGTVRFFNSKSEVRSPENLIPQESLYSISTTASSENSGRHILVFHPNHGLHSPNEKVELLGVSPDTLPVKITVSYGVTETGSISVASTETFATYDGSIISGSNPGYIKISDEIIKYGSVLSGQLGDITRSQFGTVSLPHPINSLAYKYEFNNVPLTKINTTHTVLPSPKPTIDSYYVQVSSGSTFSSDKFAGGSEIYAGRNKNFSKFKLNENFIKVSNKTSVAGRIRTVSERSVDGAETAFVDQGYESFDVLKENKFNTLRTVASNVNEVEYLNSTEFIGNKSLTLELDLITSDSKVSPIIDINQIYLDVEGFRLNQPVGITSYASDPRVNSNTEDPHAFVYVSKRVNLQQSATSIKGFISCNRNGESDVRLLYKIFRNDVPDEDQTWELFPGYLNLDVNGNVIDSDNNDGRSDLNVPISLEGEFKEYSFTIEDLPTFTGFAIKIVSSGTNQALVPIIKELRAIALA